MISFQCTLPLHRVMPRRLKKNFLTKARQLNWNPNVSLSVHTHTYCCSGATCPFMWRAAVITHRYQSEMNLFLTQRFPKWKGQTFKGITHKSPRQNDTRPVCLFCLHFSGGALMNSSRLSSQTNCSTIISAAERRWVSSHLMKGSFMLSALKTASSLDSSVVKRFIAKFSAGIPQVFKSDGRFLLVAF